jgi:hypothetical protein
MTYSLSEYQQGQLNGLANSVSPLLTIIGKNKELDDLVELGLLSDVTKLYPRRVQMFLGGSVTASDIRVLCLTETGLRMFFDNENGKVN